MPGVPRIGFSFVDVRDVADLQIRAMTAPEAGGQRLIAVGQFAWMSEVAGILRERLGDDAAKVPTRRVPNLSCGRWRVFDPGVRSIVGQLGRRSSYSSEKARTTLGWTTRPLEDTVVETGPQHARLTPPHSPARSSLLADSPARGPVARGVLAGGPVARGAIAGSGGRQSGIGGRGAWRRVGRRRVGL